MNTRRFWFVCLFFALALGACAPQQVETIKTVEVVKTVEMNSIHEAPISYPTMAPAPTQASQNYRPQPTPDVSGNYAPRPTRMPLATAMPMPVYTNPNLPKPAPQDNTFQDYGVNPYVATWEDHLSTFGLDVDTAAYTVARAYLQDGNLPPYDAIRVEEFINYFQGGYTPPLLDAFAIYTEGAPSPFLNDGTHLLRIGIQGYVVPDFARKPLNLTFVIDVSGSMADEGRLELLKNALANLVARLTAADTITIVVFTDSARLVLPPTAGDQFNTIMNAIYPLQPENSTNVEEGLHLGYQWAMSVYNPQAENRVVLCSDGVANVGIVNPQSILNEVHGYVSEGVRLSAFGVGMGNFNDVLLEQLADNGDGSYAYIDSIEEANNLFVDGLTTTLQVIALDAKVQVDFNAEVVSYYRLLGYENRGVADQDFRNDNVDAGEMSAGHSATAVYAVQFYPNAEGRIATVQMRWQDPDTREVREINQNFNTWELARDYWSASPRYRLAIAVAIYAEILRQSPYAPTTLSALSEYIGRLPADLDYDPQVVEFVNLVNQAAQIARRNGFQ